MNKVDFVFSAFSISLGLLSLVGFFSTFFENITLAFILLGVAIFLIIIGTEPYFKPFSIFIDYIPIKVGRLIRKVIASKVGIATGKIIEVIAEMFGGLLGCLFSTLAIIGGTVLIIYCIVKLIKYFWYL